MNALPGIHSNWGRVLDLVVVLTQKELRVRYKSYALGYVWSVLNPLVHAMLFYFVFQIAMKTNIPNYVAFILTGLFAWQWVANSLSTAPMNFVGNAAIIKKVPFPYVLLVLVACLQDALHFIVSIPIILGVLLWFDIPLHPVILLGVPVLAVLQLWFTFTVSLVISSLNLFFRDLERLIAMSLMFLFYGTPIIYSESMVPPELQWIFQINPMALLVMSWRALFLEGRIEWNNLALLAGLLLPLSAVSAWTYRRLRWRFAEVL